MEFWDYCNANPKEMEDFAEAMKSNSLNSMNGVLQHCDFSDIATVVDVGGGFGHMALALLARYPKLTGVLLDVPHLMPMARKHAERESGDVVARLRFHGGDMFDDVPAGQAYILKHIIHDWDDAHCIRLLKNCHTGMAENGRLRVR